ncbi:MAG TPA: glutamate--tRNA ligase family protein [Gemmatimonadales bacterium]|nr:glutamate--tRNA ligase family protein [Gemmatimonadales bacterium]
MTALDLAALAARLPSRPLTRFAPSPTGYLHLGHVANAIWVWGLARALGGRVLLRIEDHDRGRCRPEYERAMLDDLAWLGLEPDLGAEEVRAGPSSYRQSDVGAGYQAALDQLGRDGMVFGCDCSRKDLATTEGDVFNQETRYPGRCRGRGLTLAPGIGVRLRLEPQPERFVDARLGPQEQDPAQQCGDLLLRDRRGQWTYQFAVVVDDCRHQVDLVVRGEDLLPSTGRQIHLARLLGRVTPPVFLHHPLIRKAGGEKLSKAAGDTGIRELRAEGVSRAAVLGQAAALSGLLRRAEPIEPPDLAKLFSAGYDHDPYR